MWSSNVMWYPVYSNINSKGEINVTHSSVISCNSAFNKEKPHPLLDDKNDFKNVIIANCVAPGVEFKVFDPSAKAIETKAGTQPLMQSEKLCLKK